MYEDKPRKIAGMCVCIHLGIRRSLSVPIATAKKQQDARHIARGGKARESTRPMSHKRRHPDRGSSPSGSSSSSRSSSHTRQCIAGRFEHGKKIGSGSFGDIYLGQDVKTGKQLAIKLERAKTRHPQLQYESKVYRLLQTCLAHFDNCNQRDNLELLCL